jgi:mannosyltransferase
MTRRLLLLILLLAFGLRLLDLEGQSMWSDEGLTLYRARQALPALFANQIVVDGVPTTDTNPPFYFLLLHGWRTLVGESVFVLRFAGVLLATLAIPLLYAMGRLLGGRRAGMAAALLLALSPFHIWQTQVLRNYGLLVTLNLLSLYGLARFLYGRQQWRWLLLWLLASLLGIYTHFFGFFIFALGLATLGVALLLQQRAFPFVRRPVFWLLVVAGLLLLSPVLPLAIERFAAGRQIDFHPVSIATVANHAASAFAVGISRTLSHPWWLWAPGVILATCGVASGWRNRPRELLFVLAYQFVPFALLMALSTVNPLYNGVRHLLIGLPPFLLLAAWGAVGWRGAWRRVALSLTAVVVVIQLFWLWAQFNTTPLVRDDIRGAAEYIGERAQPGDVVILHDTLIAFTFDYYYSGPAPVVAIPSYGQQDPGAAVRRLEEATAAASHVWFLVEPAPRTGFSRTLLLDWARANWLEASARPFPWMWLPVELNTFLTDPFLAEMPVEAMPYAAEWPGVLRVHGFELPDHLVSGEEWWPVFYLEQEGAEAKQYSLSLRLEGEGVTWGNAERVLGGAFRPPGTWPEEMMVRMLSPMTLPAGLPPGAYQLWLRLVETETGRLVPLAGGGSELLLGERTIEAAGCDTARELWPVPAVPPITFGSSLDLVGYELPGDEYRPGHTLGVDLLWCVRQQPENGMLVRLQLLDTAGRVMAEQVDQLGRSGEAAGRPAAGQLLLHRSSLTIPASSEPGRYRARIAVLDAADERSVWAYLPLPARALTLGRVELVPWPLETALPPLEHPLGATFGEPPQVELSGFNLEERLWSAGESVPLALVWRALAPLDGNWDVLVHLVDAEGEIVAQADGAPAHGFRPTASWREGEVIVDERMLALPSDLPPGEYALWTGLYRPESWQRLEAHDEGTRQPDDRVLLAHLVVEEGDG